MSLMRERIGWVVRDGRLKGRILIVRLLDEDESVGHGTLVAVAGAIQDVAVQPECGGAAAVKVDRLLAAELDHIRCQFLKAHADGQLRLSAIDHNEEVEFVVPSDCGARMARGRAVKIQHLAVSHQCRTAADGSFDSTQIGR